MQAVDFPDEVPDEQIESHTCGPQHACNRGDKGEQAEGGRVNQVGAGLGQNLTIPGERGVMALGDGIRRNIASVDPVERDLLRSAFMKMNTPKWNGNRDDPVTVDGVSHTVPGGVTWWLKHDEIHTVTHEHHDPEVLPCHRQLINWSDDLL